MELGWGGFDRAKLDMLRIPFSKADSYSWWYEDHVWILLFEVDGRWPTFSALCMASWHCFAISAMVGWWAKVWRSRNVCRYHRNFLCGRKMGSRR